MAGMLDASTATLTVQAMHPDDWPAVRAIYAEGIATGDATFESEPPGWETWDAAHLQEHRLVACRDGAVIGWVAAVPVSGRCVYRGVVEHSVYVAASARGQGVGRMLLEEFIASTEAGGVWTIQTGIFPENTVSLSLHERCGFRRVGIRERIGEREGRWRDVVLLERRRP
jgi:L-amino acid N-acyltransferase YncA